LVTLTEDLDASDSDIADPHAAAVVGVDWDSPQFWQEHHVQLIGEATAQSYWDGLHGDQRDDFVERARSPLPLALLARASYLAGEDATVSFTAVHVPEYLVREGVEVLEGQDWLLQVDAEWNLFQKVTVAGKGLLLLGPNNGTFGGYRESSRLEASVTVPF
jgi:hypothetical protein